MEEWRAIKGFPNYFVSNLGRVKSVDRLINGKNGSKKMRKGRILKQCLNAYGYLHVGLRKNNKNNTKTIHRLVAIAFVPNPEAKPEVNHINGIKTDNCVENLEWNTSKENINHAVELGVSRGSKGENKGERNGGAKIKKEDVVRIRKIYDEQCISQAKIAKRFGVSLMQISRIVRRKKWKHIA